MSNFPDPRLSEQLLPFSKENFDQCDVVLLGVPTDEGILRNGGRVGAAQAPHEIRRQFAKLTPYANKSSIGRIKILDYGNITGKSLEEVHGKAQDATADFIREGKIVIALGGGHDITYALATGFHSGIDKKDFSLINIDAHLDVREKKNGLHHSGSSFRLLIEENILLGESFTEYGIQNFSAAQSHITWLEEQQSKIFFYDEIHKAKTALKLPLDNSLYLSFDIDCIRSSDAPGSSAPSPIGFSAEEALDICYKAGLHPTTRMLDIVEVNPLFDQDGRTAKLAARMIASFLLGVSKR